LNFSNNQELKIKKNLIGSNIILGRGKKVGAFKMELYYDIFD